MAEPRLRVRELRNLTWWIALLFMIGSAYFALGCVLFLSGFSHDFVLDAVFFTGSIFFTTAAYCQLHQVINTGEGARRWLDWQPRNIPFLSAFSQFIGTILFNMNTFDAFLDLGWLGQDLLIWAPDILGSILFQISGSLAMLDICKRWWCWTPASIDWRIGVINFAGCVAFLISAFLAFNYPGGTLPELSTLSTVFTLIGAFCFFVGAFLMLRHPR